MNAALFNDHAAHHESVQHQNSRLPPWERNRNNIVQVPFMGRSRSPMRDAKHPQLIEVSAAKDMEQSTHGQHSNGLLTPHNDVLWKASRDHIPPAPASAPPRETMQSPYESIKIPQGPKSAPQVPAFVNRRANVPPRFDPSRTFNSNSDHIQAQEPSSLAGPQPKPAPAFPGTMAARQQEYPRRLNGTGKWNNKSDSPGFARRFMSSFKNMFKRDPVCEGEFERIEERHWSE